MKTKLRNLLGGLTVASIALLTAPASADATLQVVAMGNDRGLALSIDSMDRTNRILDIGPEIFAGIAAGHYSPPKQDIPLTVYFWMKGGDLPDEITVENVASYGYKNGKLVADVDMLDTPVITDPWFTIYAMDGIDGFPDGAIEVTLDGYALGFQLPTQLLEEVELIMVCPDIDKMTWPRRDVEQGVREGIVIVRKEIDRWLGRVDGKEYHTPTVGMMEASM